MQSWDSLGFLILVLNYNVTIIGKIWLTLTVLLRLLVIFFAAYPLYQDEQQRFICNTLQPGCANVCYDLFAPVSHFRFWLVQTASVLLPYTMFCVYVFHNVARQLVKARSLPYRRYKEIKATSGHKISKKSSKSAAGGRVASEANKMDIPDFSQAYTVQLLLRMLLEACFGAGHYYLFGFFVPRRFACYQFPCANYVECFVSRPTEKSIMMFFVWGLSGFSFLLSLIDLTFAFRSNIVRNYRNKLLLERLGSEERCGPGMLQGNKPNKDLLDFGRGGQGILVTPDSCDHVNSCLLGCEVKEDLAFQPALTSQPTISFNLNSNKPCVASTQDGKGALFQGSEPREILHEQSRSNPLPGPLKGALALKPQDGGNRGVSSSGSFNKPSVHYSTLERKPSDVQSACSGSGCSKAKKSEWV
ncbi:gap junction delta-4 protein-like [Eublepharis macularius]|uniref:Gap junction protein n=1 Tax=Eublepharis macularius TaxID=481883 RepID=A0AA97LA68_EUBMA|nr:gap junction delta-4 protein-like [Eublepharis macularius]